MKKGLFFFMLFIFIVSDTNCVLKEIDKIERQEQEKERIALIKKNSFSGTVMSVSLRLENGQTMIKGDPAGNAVAGGASGWFFFGPVGGVIGAVAGADSKITQENVPAKIMEMVVSVKSDSNDQIYHFNIIDSGKDAIGKTTPSKFTLATALQPGDKIKIPSQQQLSRTATVWSCYIKLPGEKIPELDE